MGFTPNGWIIFSLDGRGEIFILMDGLVLPSCVGVFYPDEGVSFTMMDSWTQGFRVQLGPILGIICLLKYLS